MEYSAANASAGISNRTTDSKTFFMVVVLRVL